MRSNIVGFVGMFFIVLYLSLATAIPSDVTLPKVKIEQGINSKLTDVRQGYWKITGAGQLDKKYVGINYIVKADGSPVYMIRQNVGAQISDGVGIVLDNKLVISWKYTDNTVYGLTYVTFNGDKGAAKWVSVPGDGKLVDERWTFLTGNDED